jgi:WD40 repeat protein
LYARYPHPVAALASAKQGSLLAVASGAVVSLLDTRTRTVLAEYRDPPSSVQRVALSPDGSRLAIARRAHGIQVINTITAAVLLTYARHTGRVSALAFSPDGGDLASASIPQRVLGGRAIALTSSKQSLIRVWDVRTGDEVMTYHGHRLGVLSLGWSPDGQHLASGGEDNQVQLWRVLTGERLACYRGQRHTVSGLAWSPDGSEIAAVSLDRTLHIWSPWRRSPGEGESEVYEHQASKRTELLAVAWSPDGTRLAAGEQGGAVQIIDRGTRQALSSQAHQEAVIAVAWSADNAHVFSASLDHTIRLWQAPQVASGLAKP